MKMTFEHSLLNQVDIFDALDRAVIVSATDEEGKIIYANPLFCKVSGYSAQELIGQDHRIVNSGIHPKSFFKELWDQLKKGNEWKGIISNKNKNGEIYHVKTTITPIRLKDGKICYFSVRKDITPEINLRNKLEYFNETHKIVSDAANLGAWDWNISENTLIWNDQIYKIFDVEPQSFEATYEAFLSFCHPDDVDKINLAVEKSLSNPNVKYQIEHRVLTREGNIKSVLETGEVFRNSDGIPVRMMGIVQDITELNNQKLLVERQKEQILEASKMSALGEMAGSISHEINTPIAVILVNAEKTLRMLKNKEENCIAEINDSLKTIINTSMHISDIVKTLKRISRNDFQIQEKAEISTNEIIKDLQTISSERIKNKGIELLFEIENENELLKTNNSLLQQIMINLLNNSMYAIKDLDNKWIKIQGKKLDGQYEFRICDSGNGIDSEVANKMFQPFYTTKQIGQGTGVGLGVSLSYAQALGGTLTYDSKSKNTCFILRFPVSS